jgi:hypothetical protein
VDDTVYGPLGTRPVVNASGIHTDLAGAIVSPVVWAAMTEEASPHVLDDGRTAPRGGASRPEGALDGLGFSGCESAHHLSFGRPF